MTGGSQQLRQFRIAMRDGATVEAAAELAGISITEARLTVKADEANPPPPEAYELLKVQPKEETMPKQDLNDDPVDRDYNPLIELTADTLRGDIRDSLLAWFKAQPKAWPFMGEVEQRALADAADRYSYQLIKDASKLIAAGERPCIVATLVEYREKDGVEAKLKLPSRGEVVAALHEAVGREVLIVASGEEAFEGEAGPAEIDVDSPNFPNLGGEYEDA